MVASTWREWYICSCIIIQSLDHSFALGMPAVLSTVLTSNTTGNGEIHITREEASWITASYSITGPIGYLIIPTLMQMFGRRFVFIITNSFMLTGSIMIASAANFPTLIAGRAMQGIVFCKLPVGNIILGEYSHPRRRGPFLLSKIVLVYTSILLCHGLSAVLTWRQLTWLACFPSVIGLLAPFTWPETPYWLAYKSRFDECEHVFKLIRGSDKESKKEIKEIILAQQTIKRQNILRNSSTFVWVFDTLSSKEFLKTLGIATTTVVIIHCSGSYFLFAYIIEIMTDITGNKTKSLYFSLGADFMKILASFLAIVLERRFSRKALFKYTGLIALSFLGLMCVTDFLNKRGFINVAWLPASFLMLYCFFANTGFIPLASIMKGEIFPLEFRGIGASTTGVIHALIGFIVLKVTSNMLAALDTYGTFAVYLVITATALILIHFIAPETKDRTLQDIENEVTGLKLTYTEKNGEDAIDEETTNILTK